MAHQTRGVRSILLTDPVWSAYALADLQPAFEPLCHWTPAESPQGPGLILLFTGLKPTVLMSIGPASAVAVALERSASSGSLPAQVYLSVREEHLPAVERFYDSSADRRPMVRMVLPLNGRLAKPDPMPQRLQAAHAEQLRRLYAYGGPFAPDAFDPYQLVDGVFHGVADETGDLMAAGGTHIINRSEGVAAIGNVYTRPDCRGRGYASAITAAVVHTLRTEAISTIVLNVDQRNRAARLLYDKLGFQEHCPFIEGKAQRR